MQIITRKEWGARDPESVTKVAWSKRTRFVVHYSGTSVEPTPKSVQNYHMDSRGWSDVGYHFLVSNSTGKIYEGRGWGVLGAHVAGHNTESIGVVVLKKGDEPITDKAKTSVRELAAEADRRKRKKLIRCGHRDLASTDCPGDKLEAWVKAGMPLAPAPKPTPAPTPTPAPEPASTETEDIMRALPTLRMGDGRPKAVKRVQALVNLDGAGLLEDGIWREKTDAAVRRYQERHNIPNSVTAAGRGDGIWGPQCWRFALLAD